LPSADIAEINDCQSAQPPDQLSGCRKRRRPRAMGVRESSLKREMDSARPSAVARSRLTSSTPAVFRASNLARGRGEISDNDRIIRAVAALQTLAAPVHRTTVPRSVEEKLRGTLG
jgi:hypothetical protein